MRTAFDFEIEDGNEKDCLWCTLSVDFIALREQINEIGIDAVKDLFLKATWDKLVESGGN